MGGRGTVVTLLLTLLTIISSIIAVDGSWLFKTNENRPNVQVERTVLRMPEISSPQNESYLCTAFPLNDKVTTYIVGFNPIVDSHSVHHVLLFACEEAGSSEEVWDCGEMNTNSRRYSRSATCTSQPSILYAWAKDAPELKLPQGVGFRVGGDTSNSYLVLQVHYMGATDKDVSGLEVSSTVNELPKTAATLLLATGGSVRPKSTELFEVACAIDEPVQLHPFAYRVHTHRHGQKVFGWLVSSDPEKVEQRKWNLLGERDPQLPELFQPVDNQSLVVHRGDIVAARCIIKNDENLEIEIGPTGNDEMCNFYLMYWVEGNRILKDNTCFSPGPPGYYWSKGLRGKEIIAGHPRL